MHGSHQPLRVGARVRRAPTCRRRRRAHTGLVGGGARVQTLALGANPALVLRHLAGLGEVCTLGVRGKWGNTGGGAEASLLVHGGGP